MLLFKDMELLANLIDVGKDVKNTKLSKDEAVSQEDINQFEFLLDSAQKFLDSKQKTKNIIKVKAIVADTKLQKLINIEKDISDIKNIKDIKDLLQISKDKILNLKSLIITIDNGKTIKEIDLALNTNNQKNISFKAPQLKNNINLQPKKQEKPTL